MFFFRLLYLVQFHGNCTDLFLTVFTHITARSYPIVSDRTVPLDFSRYFVTFLLLLFSSFATLIRELGRRDDRFMDSSDNGGSGGSRVEDGESGKRRSADKNIFTAAYPSSSEIRDIHIRKIFFARYASFPHSLPAVAAGAKLANQIRSRPPVVRNVVVQRPRKVRIYSRPSVCLVSAVKSSPRTPRIPLNTTA